MTDATSGSMDVRTFLIALGRGRPGGNPSRGAAPWQQADRRAVDRAAWVPLVNSLGIDVLGRGVENAQRNPEWSVLLDQLWAR